MSFANGRFHIFGTNSAFTFILQPDDVIEATKFFSSLITAHIAFFMLCSVMVIAARTPKPRLP